MKDLEGESKHQSEQKRLKRKQKQKKNSQFHETQMPKTNQLELLFARSTEMPKD